MKKSFSDQYNARCERSADEQGITAIAEALTAVGVDVEIEQTGGFIMVAYVRPPDGRVIAMNDDGGINAYLFPSEDAEVRGDLLASYNFNTPAEAAVKVAALLTEGTV